MMRNIPANAMFFPGKIIFPLFYFYLFQFLITDMTLYNIYGHILYLISHNQYFVFLIQYFVFLIQYSKFHNTIWDGIFHFFAFLSNTLYRTERYIIGQS